MKTRFMAAPAACRRRLPEKPVMLSLLSFTLAWLSTKRVFSKGGADLPK